MIQAPILNIDAAPSQEWRHGTGYEATIRWASLALESRLLGFNVTTVAPGRKAFPYHAHRANEEMFFVLEGEGSIRIDGQTHRIRRGDFISLPPGPRSAHQIVNDSKAPLRYLAVSTMLTPEVVEYLDSGKIGVLAGAPAGRPPTQESIRHFARVGDGIDYWEGED